MSFKAIMLLASLLSSGLMAGLFFGWLVSVIPGTSAVDDRSYILTMQNINREILNPAFLVAFLVTPLVLGTAAVLHFRAGQTRRAYVLVAAAVTYLVGVIGVTAGGNVPLNNTLEQFDFETASSSEVTAARDAYETPWNQWHNVRTFASIASLSLAALAAALSDAE